MHLVIYGPEGSGKGTQADFLSKKYHLPVYTSGDLVRDAAQNDTGKIGDACRKALSEGYYVSDDDMFSLWKQKLESPESKKGFILDGFPRNINQAQFLLSEIKSQGYSLDKVIFLNLTDEESIKRLSLRDRKLFAGSTVSHDSPERVKKRLQEYRSKESELVAFFKSKDKLVQIDASGSREDIFSDIVASLPSL